MTKRDHQRISLRNELLVLAAIVAGVCLLATLGLTTLGLGES
jgi:hypothetical protein